MVIPISIVFIICAIQYYKLKYHNHIPHKKLLIIWIILTIIAGLRPEQMPDYRDYKIGYQLLDNTDFGRWEPLYWLLMKTLHLIRANFSVLLFVMAMLSIGIRLYAIDLVSPFIWGSITIYLSNFYILHDMIQIRCAVASGLLILAVYYKVNTQLLNFLKTALIALLFHYSAIIIFPLWYIGNKTSNRKIYTILIPITYILVSIFHFHSTILFSKLPFVGSYIESYALNIQQGEVNIYNALQLLRCFICLILWLCIKRINYNRYFVAFLKIYTIGLCCFPLFSDIYVIAFRVSEFLLVSEIIVIPYLAYIFKPYIKLGKLSVISVATIFLLMNIFFNKYLT